VRPKTPAISAEADAALRTLRLAATGLVLLRPLAGFYFGVDSSARLLRHLDLRLAPNSRFLVGHSDITSLHLALTRTLASGRFSTRSKHCNPPVAGRLVSKRAKPAFAARQLVHERLRIGRATGVLARQEIRGAFAWSFPLLASAVGTDFAPRPSGTILFLEDTGEPPCRIDRMLTQLGNAGISDQVRGVAFGAMTKCLDPYNDLKSAFRDFFAGFSFPIAFGLRSGHGDVNLSIRLGDTLRWTAQLGESELPRLFYRPYFTSEPCC
jgi:muramoyltetrapeptide carboxypeptidase